MGVVNHAPAKGGDIKCPVTGLPMDVSVCTVNQQRYPQACKQSGCEEAA